MTASAGPTPPGAAACPAWPSGSPWSTGAWISPARPAGRPPSPSSFRPTFTDEGLRAAWEQRRTHPGIAVLVLSQYIETRYAAQLLHGSPAGVGYLLKNRVADVAEFTDAVGRVAAGGTALDREVVSQLLAASRHAGDLDPLAPRERDVL